MAEKNLVVILLNNVRSLHNVGSILRTADAAGIEAVVCTGITPYPLLPNDPRPLFEAKKTTGLLAKTALGAENTLTCQHFDDPLEAIRDFRARGFAVAALEQAPNSVNLFEYQPKRPLLLILGHEVDGVDQKLLAGADVILEIPMRGQKESLNVSVAAGIAAYQLVRGS